MPLLQTSGNITADGYGGGAAAVPQYIEDVFSTWLIKTPGSTTAVGAVNNGIDLSTKGGMVWLKDRNYAYSHTLVDTARGANQRLISNTDAAQTSTSTYGFTSFNTNGFTLGAGGGVLFDNGSSGTNVVTWTFREQAKFFDVVTYTGNGATTARAIAHSLGAVPGCIIVIPINDTGDRKVYHRSLGETKQLKLQLTDASSNTPCWGSTAPTSTNFYVAFNETNKNGIDYVAYIYAHDAGGFGLTGTDNVISCGGTSLDASGFATVSLGYEPQFVMIKSTEFAGDWAIYDTMRGAVALKSTDLYSAFSAQKLLANSSAAESTATDYTIAPSSTGFTLSATGYAGAAYDNFIYIAIRRGPMKVPTSGTSVFGLNARTGNDVDTTVTGGQTDDLAVIKVRSGLTQGSLWTTRLTSNKTLLSSSTATESTASTAVLQTNPWDVMNGVKVGAGGTTTNNSSATYINWLFKRAPNFYDTVCYTGTGANRTVSHNLGAVPELIIVKQRSDSQNWFVYNATSGNTKYTILNSTAADATLSSAWNNTSPTSSVFTVGTAAAVNTNNGTYIAHLFATCAGVSKVGSYTGNGSSQTINCGFTGGARFVLIKCTSTTGAWYVYDTARGMTVLTDPYLLLNSTAAESATLGSVTTVSTGFAVDDSILAGINTNAATYIFLAIA